MPDISKVPDLEKLHRKYLAIYPRIGDHETWTKKMHMDAEIVKYLLTLVTQGTDPNTIPGGNVVNAALAAVDKQNEIKENPVGAVSGGYQLKGSNSKITWDFLVGHGFTQEAAAGVIGNLMQESHINPTSKDGIARGIAQWTYNERWLSLTKWAQKQGKDPWGLTTQLEYILIELQNQGLLSKLKTMTNVIQASDLFESKFERPGKPRRDKRHAYALEAYKAFRN